MFPLSTSFSTVVLGSKNPSKISAIHRLFHHSSNSTKFHALDLGKLDEVPEQPMNDVDTIKGCKRRAEEARRMYLEQVERYKDSTEMDALKDTLFIGLEGGISSVDEHTHFQTTWCYVLQGDADSEERSDEPRLDGLGASARFALPNHIVHMMHNDTAELGNVLHFANTEEKNKGAIWKYSQGCISREDLNVQALQMALIQLHSKREMLQKRQELLEEQEE